MRRILKGVLCTLVALVALPVVLVSLLYIPPVQNWLVNTVAGYATEGTGLNVSVERVGLTWPLDLDVRGVLVTDEAADTILNVERVVVDLELSRLFSDMTLGVDEIKLEQGFVNTRELIDGLQAQGRIGLVGVAAPSGIELENNKIVVKDILLSDCDINVFIGEIPESPEDTASTALPWLIDVEDVQICNVHALVEMVDTAGSTTIETLLTDAKASGISARLEENDYFLKSLSACVDYVRIDSLNLPSLCATLDDVAFLDHSKTQKPSTAEKLKNSKTQKLRAKAEKTQKLKVALARLTCSESWIEATADATLEQAIIPDFTATLRGHVANADLDSLCRYFDLPLMAYNPKAEITLKMDARNEGNTITIKDGCIDWTDVALLTVDATATNPLDSALAATVRADLHSLVGNANIAASYKALTNSYNAHLVLDRIHPSAFVRSLPPLSLSGTAEISGRGKTGNLHAVINSDNDALRAQMLADVIMGQRGVAGTMSLDLTKADLKAFGLVDSTLSVGACLHVDVGSDLKSSHRLTGHLNDLLLIRPDTIYRPVNVDLDVMVRPDSLFAHFAAGEMLVDAAASSGVDKLRKQLMVFVDEVQRQIKEDHFIDQNALKPLLPSADVCLRISGRNPISTILAMRGYTYDNVRFDLNSNPENGLNGNGQILALSNGTMLLDTVQWAIFQDSAGVKMDTRLRNGPKNKQFVFDARLNAYFLGDGAGATLTYTDGKGKCGINVGALVNLTPQGVRVHLAPHNPVVAYRNFNINKENYLLLARNGQIFADLNLVADDGTAVQLCSTDQPTDSLPENAPTDLTASFSHFNLGELSSVLPYMPVLGGMLSGDAHYIQDGDMMSVALDAEVQRFAFEGSLVGDVGLNATYLPGDNGEHFVDGLMLLNGQDVGSFSGVYAAVAETDSIAVDAMLNQFPFSAANGFVDKNLAQLSGVMNGEIHVTGSSDKPLVNGALGTSGMNIRSNDYSLLLKVEDNTIGIVDNYLSINEVKVFSVGKNPVKIDGFVDFRNFSDPRFNLDMTGRNFQLINAKKSHTALAYGKVFCDLDAHIKGGLENLSMTGSLGVLGNTDVTYVLRDSPLTVEDRLKDLVTFVDFENEDAEEEEAASSSLDIDMRMKVSIDDAAQVHCLLSEDRSSYVDIEGGGELIMTYSPQGEMQLNGRYTINSGEMKYQLPVIPLKTFKIASGSYVAFNGPMLNPTLNLIATERTRALVGSEGGATRSVAFDVGVEITQTLEKMGLQFTIDAPEDATIQNELQTMDAATRGRMAVTMLATGMYLSDSNPAAFNTENALNSFLQNEISNLAGKALSSVDLTFGMENSTSATGATQTDYSFRFAKHFWGNRISVVLGGTVSSGSEAENTGATLIDNVSIEYRLDQSATRYVRVFYDKAYESLLDGKITEMGAGLVLRRKTTRLGDLFIFRKKKP